MADAALHCRYLLPLLQINRQLAPFHRSCYEAIYFTGVIPFSERPERNCRTLQGLAERKRETAWVGGREMDGRRNSA